MMRHDIYGTCSLCPDADVISVKLQLATYKQRARDAETQAAELSSSFQQRASSTHHQVREDSQRLPVQSSIRAVVKQMTTSLSKSIGQNSHRLCIDPLATNSTWKSGGAEPHALGHQRDVLAISMCTCRIMALR